MGASDNVLIDFNHRTFFISDNIDNESIGKLCFNLILLLQQDNDEDKNKKDYERKPIHIYINSNGGNVYDMWGLIDIIINSKTPIYTYCTGYAMSAAFNIFIAGHKRYATEHATFLYHQLSSCPSGKYQDLNEFKEELDWLQDKIEKYVLNQTIIDKEIIKESRIKKRDIYFHIKDALNNKIVDEILERI